MDIGFVEAGLQPVWANDFAPNAVATYNEHFASVAPGHTATCGSIDDLLGKHLVPGEGAADLVIGGPPCQGFSVAGKMNPGDPRSRHIWRFLEVVERVQPRAFVMENVGALALNQRWAPLIAGLERRAHELEYDTTLLVLNASHFGVPQARTRMFLIGTRDARDVLVHTVSQDRPPTVREALSALPPIGEEGNDTFCRAKITPAKNPVLRRSPFAGMLFNGKGRPLNLDAPATTLPASMGGNKTPIVDQLSLDEDAEPWVISYHRRLWNGGAPVKRIPRRLRRLTVEEAAAVQTFPTGMTWHGGISDRFGQIGNAVPPQMAYHVAISVSRALGLPLAESDAA
jgi:DNA (cytosine-5)-methyltransferase 1